MKILEDWNSVQTRAEQEENGENPFILKTDLNPLNAMSVENKCN